MEFGKRFYTGKLNFPLPDHLEPAGEESFLLDFIGGPYEFVGLTDKQREAAEKKYSALHFQRSAADVLPVRIFFSRVAHENFCFVDFSREVYRFDLDYDDQRIDLVGRYFYGSIEPGSVTNFCRICLPMLESGEFAMIFNNVFRTVMAYRFLASGGALMHSGAVVRDGAAFLFVGHSGAGKSTVSGLSAKLGYKVLSDDMNAIMPDRKNGGFVVEKIPYTGDFDYAPPRPERYPLKGIFLIKQAEKHALKPISHSLAIARLVGCAPYVNLDPWRQDVLFSNIGQMIKSAGASRLNFCLDGAFWDLIKDGRVTTSFQ